MNFNRLGELVQSARFELDCATRILDQATEDMSKIVIRYADIKEAQVLAQGVAQEVQDRTYGCIAGIVTQCLEAVFEEPYKFRLDFVKKRGKTEAVLAFERDGWYLWRWLAYRC